MLYFTGSDERVRMQVSDCFYRLSVILIRLLDHFAKTFQFFFAFLLSVFGEDTSDKFPAHISRLVSQRSLCLVRDSCVLTMPCCLCLVSVVLTV